MIPSTIVNAGFHKTVTKAFKKSLPRCIAIILFTRKKNEKYALKNEHEIPHKINHGQE